MIFNKEISKNIFQVASWETQCMIIKYSLNELLKNEPKSNHIKILRKETAWEFISHLTHDTS